MSLDVFFLFVLLCFCFACCCCCYISFFIWLFCIFVVVVRRIHVGFLWVCCCCCCCFIFVVVANLVMKRVITWLRYYIIALLLCNIVWHVFHIQNTFRIMFYLAYCRFVFNFKTYLLAYYFWINLNMLHLI